MSSSPVAVDQPVFASRHHKLPGEGTLRRRGIGVEGLGFGFSVRGHCADFRAGNITLAHTGFRVSGLGFWAWLPCERTPREANITLEHPHVEI